MSDFLKMRKNMVDGQLVPEYVTNASLIEAFRTIPREQFVPHQLKSIAYMDADFPLTKGRSLLRPSILGRLLEALDPQIDDNILYIAGGTGYGPALLGTIAHRVVALDEEEKFTQETERLADELHLPSIMVVLGRLEKGWEEEAPYQKILIEGCVDTIPTKLTAQLKDGGSLITLKHNQEDTAIRITKKQDILTENYLFDAFGPRLNAFRSEKIFIL
jgi:protein-L-isoaspartate(D-aspartate) O-methyltransferase